MIHTRPARTHIQYLYVPVEYYGIQFIQYLYLSNTQSKLNSRLYLYSNQYGYSTCMSTFKENFISYMKNEVL